MFFEVVCLSRFLSGSLSRQRTFTKNTNNLIVIDCLQNGGSLRSTQSHKTPSKVPKLMLSNVMSLVPKLDEVRDFLHLHEINLAFITETWLKESISESVVSIPGSTVLRRDRQRDQHGGVCVYIKDDKCNFKQINELNCCEDHETLWLYLRPNRLPRGFSCIVAGVVYHPPRSDERSIREHLFNSLTLAESKHPNCGILVTGDFNRLDISGLLNHFRLKQIVKVPTRRNATLDLVLTNMHDYYYSPQAYPPFGLSDHNTVVASPKVKEHQSNTKKVITRRDQRKSRKDEMGRYLSLVDWSSMSAPLNSCEEMWNGFYGVVHTGLDLLMLEKQIRICTADAPCMTHKLKSLILKRQKNVQQIRYGFC